MIRYEVVITGDEAPYKWQLTRQGPGSTSIKLGDAGECDTHKECLWEARDAAVLRECDRKYAETKRTEIVLEVDGETAPTPDPPRSAFNFESPYDGA